MNDETPEPALSADVIGRYEKRLWRMPVWLVVAALLLAVFAVLSNVATGEPNRAVVPAVAGALLLAAALRSRRRPSEVSTEITQDCALISSTAGKRDVVPWEQVAGVRVFHRYSRPQVVLVDGSPVQLLAVPDEVARSLAAQLPGVLARPVWFEVDDHRADPAAVAPVTAEH